MMSPRQKLKGQMMRFAEGAEVKTFGAIDSDMDTKGTRKVENKQSFKEAFATARAKMKSGGPKVFTWNGKSYTTETREEKAAREKRASTGTGTPSSSSAAASSSTPANKSTATTTSQRLETRAKNQQSGREALAKARGEPVRYGFQDLLGLTRSAQSRGAAGRARRLEAELTAEKAKEKEARAALPGAAAKQKKTPYGFQHLLGLDSESRAVKNINNSAFRRRQIEKELAALEGKAKGGKVKKYASGGKVSSASKRADGIAIRGKTRAR